MSGAKFHPSIADQMTFQQQPDAFLSKVNPVSGTLYEVLPTTKNVEILSIATNITWAVTQPTPLRVQVVVDGRTRQFDANSPVSTVQYCPNLDYCNADEISQSMSTRAPITVGQIQAAKVCSGRSVQVLVRVTWAVTQPTPLDCRVKWAKR